MLSRKTLNSQMETSKSNKNHFDSGGVECVMPTSQANDNGGDVNGTVYHSPLCDVVH